MARGGWCECYSSIGIKLVYIFAEFKIFFKAPCPFKQQKRFLSGLTTFHVYYWLNHVLVLLNKDDMLLIIPYWQKFLNDLVESLAWPPALAAQFQVARSPVHLHVFPAPEQCFFKGTVSRAGLGLILAWSPVHFHVFPAPSNIFLKGLSHELYCPLFLLGRPCTSTYFLHHAIFLLRVCITSWIGPYFGLFV